MEWKLANYICTADASKCSKYFFTLHLAPSLLDFNCTPFETMCISAPKRPTICAHLNTRDDIGHQKERPSQHAKTSLRQLPSFLETLGRPSYTCAAHCRAVQLQNVTTFQVHQKTSRSRSCHIHHVHRLRLEPGNNTSLVFMAAQLHLQLQTNFHSITYDGRIKKNGNVLYETQTQVKSKRCGHVSSDDNAQTVISTMLLMYSFSFKPAFNVRTLVQNVYIIDF